MFSGTKLKALRLERGLTQEALARRMVALGAERVQSQHIAAWERGVVPKADVLLALAKALGVHIEDLYTS